MVLADGSVVGPRRGAGAGARVARTAEWRWTPSSCGTASWPRDGRQWHRPGTRHWWPSGLPTRARRCSPGTAPPANPMARPSCGRTADRASSATDSPAHAERLAHLTGLELDPYFVAPKMVWLRDRVPAGLTITTTDTWLLHRLCGAFVTDVATAGRTLLLDLETGAWSDEACEIFGIEPASLARVVGNAEPLGDCTVFGGKRAGHRRVRGPAGSTVRGGVPRSGAGEVHVRHRRVHAGVHGRRAHSQHERTRRMPGLATRRRRSPGASTDRCTPSARR